jgi:hypothetical protein
LRRHRIERGKITRAALRIAAVERQLAALSKQTAAQRGLEQSQPFKRVAQGNFGSVSARANPMRLNLPDPFEYQFVVVAVRAAMEWEAEAECGAIVGGEQQAVAAKVIEANPLRSQRCDQRVEAAVREELARQNVMALQSGLVTGRAAAIDRAEGQTGSAWVTGHAAAVKP